MTRLGRLSRFVGFALLAFVAPAVWACGDDGLLGPAESVTIALTINSMNPSDIEAGIIEKDENISTETGNPWGEFVAAAREECLGDPAGFRVVAASLGVDVAGSQNVTGLEDVISGQAIVFFASTRGSDADAVRVNVASATGLSGPGPVSLNVLASRADLNVLLERLAGGDFHVGLRAETSRTENDSFSMDARVTFRARAHCS